VPILHAIVLGIVQGLSEFLPISSSGHLLLVPWVMDWNDLEDPGVKKAFDVALHLGTLVAVAAYFRRDIVVYMRDGTAAIVRRKVPPTPEGRLALLLVLSTVPAALVGAFFENWIDTTLGTPAIIGVSLIVFALVLWWADRRSGSRRVEQYRLRDSLIVGSAQALALNPGTSRSGITMSAAMFLGFDRDSAARLSFLMSLPVIAGAVVFKMGGLVADGIPEGLLLPMFAGIVASGLSGWVAVWGTLKLLRTHSFAPFVVYRIVVGVLVLGLVALR
jgi:undecaprenyl-diphosphatase